VNLHRENEQLVLTVEAVPAFLGSFRDLKIIASAVLFESIFERTVR
jgi:hypothetical protein